MAMVSASAFPDTVLEDIISFALYIPVSPYPLRTSERGTIKFREVAVRPPRSSDPRTWPKTVTWKPDPIRKIGALPLLLCSRRVSKLTTRMILLRARFVVCTTGSLEQLLDVAGEERTRLIKVLDINLYSDDDYYADWSDSSASEAAIQRQTELMARLPIGLRNLKVTAPYHEWPYFSPERGTHPRLQIALQRFVNLQELELDFYTHWLHLDTFCNATKSFDYLYGSIDWTKPVPMTPMFPHLRRLCLNGCVGEGVAPVHMTKAFSEQQLPSLESLTIDGLLLDDVYQESVFSPEVLLGMHRLLEFEWITYDFETDIRKTLGNPHAPPNVDHLAALRTRHGETLRVLKIDYKGYEIWRPNFFGMIKQANFDTLLEGLKVLKHVSINVPELGIKLVERDRRALA